MARISQLSDTDIAITGDVIAHLQYYGCILLLDISQFSAIYASTAKIGITFTDLALQHECVRYVSVTTEQVDVNIILQLYASLRHGVTLEAWYVKNSASLTGLDVRRLVTFGVIKGFLYRVFKYALNSAPAGSGRRDLQQAVDRGGESIIGPTAQSHVFAKYLDGEQRFDETCAEQAMHAQSIMKELQKFSDTKIIYR